MRITNRMINDNVYRNAGMHLEKMERLQNQLASGRAISKPSDDPTAVNQSMLLRNTLADQEQFVRNINQATTWMEKSATSSRNARQSLAPEVSLVSWSTLLISRGRHPEARRFLEPGEGWRARYRT